MADSIVKRLNKLASKGKIRTFKANETSINKFIAENKDINNAIQALHLKKLINQLTIAKELLGQCYANKDITIKVTEVKHDKLKDSGVLVKVSIIHCNGIATRLINAAKLYGMIISNALVSISELDFKAAQQAVIDMLNQVEHTETNEQYLAYATKLNDMLSEQEKLYADIAEFL